MCHTSTFVFLLPNLINTKMEKLKKFKFIIFSAPSHLLLQWQADITGQNKSFGKH